MEPSAKPLPTTPLVWVVFFTALLVALCPSLATAEFTPIAGWDQHLFPSYIIATATVRQTTEEKDAATHDAIIGDPRGSLGIRIKSPADNTSVKVTITSDSILQSSDYVATLPKKDVQYSIFPPIKYKYPALVRNKQTVPVAVTYRVELAGQKAEEQTVTPTLRSINDCPISYYDNNENVTDVSFVFAAYVNEAHPQVDEILREALKEGVVDSFSGYSEDAKEGPKMVLRQAYAIWHVLNKRGVRYSDSTTTVGESDAINSQSVRLIEESLNNAQANCVDGSVLFASLLRKIGIEPFLIFVPRHCYVGFYLDADEKQRIAIETTRIGSKADPEDDREIEGFADVVDEDWAKTESWATFVDAVQTGSEDLKKNGAKCESGKDPDYNFIPIVKARQAGILPIPFMPAGKD
jgi:hypothetical protein